MELQLYDNLPCPMWSNLERTLKEKFGRKMNLKLGHMAKRSAGVLRTYFREVFNPIILKDFKEKHKIEMQNGRLLNGM